MKLKTAIKLKCVLFAALALNASGGNLYLGDTSAETQVDTLTKGKFSSGLVPCHWDATTAFDGKKSVRVDWDRKQRVIVTEPPVLWFDKWISAADTPALKMGETYTLSFYAKASADNYPLTLYLKPSSGQLFYAPGGNYDKKLSLTRQWTRHSLTFVPNMKVDAPTKGYSAILDFSGSPVGSIWYDALQIEEGGTPTPYENASQMNVGVSLNSTHWSNIYLPDEPVIATMLVDIPVGKAELHCRVVDYQGKTVMDFKKEVAGQEEIEAPLDNQRLGWFKVTAELSSAGKLGGRHSVNYIKIAEPAEVAPGTQPFSGLINSDGFDYFDISRKIGAKRMQIHAKWGARWWSSIETAPGKFDWSALEWQLKRGKEFGMVNKLLANPFDVPDWHFDKEELAKARKVNSLLILGHDKHGAWRNFIGELTRRYGGLIDEFELGAEDNGRLGHNEYYMSLYPDEVKKNSGGNPFLVGGKPFDDLCAMVIIGAAEIRKTHPDMKIGAIRPSRCGNTDDLLFVREMFKKVGKDFNILPLDFYFYPFDFGPLIPTRRPKSDGLIDFYKDAKSVTLEWGCDQPIYMSEFGWFPDARFPDDSIYRQEQAETMPKDFIVARVAGFYAFDWFIGFGGVTHGKYSSAMNQDLSIQSIAAAYSAAARVVENVTESKWLTPDSVTRIAVMRKHDGKGVAAVWADKGYKMTLPPKSFFESIFGSELAFTDLMGNPLEPINGQLDLAQAPIYIWHDDFNELSATLAKAEIEMTESCDIKFRLIAENKGRLRFVNRSNDKDVAINATISVGDSKTSETLNVSKGAALERNIPLPSKADAVKVVAGSGKYTMERSFALPALTPIPSGSSAAGLIASASSRGDIIPPDPWVPWEGPEDLSVEITSSWDAGNLYLKAKITDESHFNKKPDAPWCADSIQIGIDPKNDGAFYVPANGKILGPDDFEFGLALGDDGKSHCVNVHGKNICKYSIIRDKKEKTTVYDLRLPWKDLGVEPYSGKVFGMSFVIFDDDTGSGQCYYIPIGGGIAGGKNPALYKKFVLE